LAYPQRFTNASLVTKEASNSQAKKKQKNAEMVACGTTIEVI
jgi:hypothetical protein